MGEDKIKEGKVSKNKKQPVKKSGKNDRTKKTVSNLDYLGFCTAFDELYRSLTL